MASRFGISHHTSAIVAMLALTGCTGGVGPSDGSDAVAVDSTLDDVGFPGFDVPAFDAPAPTCLSDGATPAPAPDAGFPVVQIAAGERHTCALRGDGIVLCWGHNGGGELGDGSTVSHARPTPVPGLTNVQQIGAGGRHSCALLRDGSAWCWGENESGQLGDGTHAARTLPTRVVAPGITFVSLAVGANHTCAVASDGRGFCWGLDDQCQLADPNTSAAHDAPAPLSLMHVHAMAAGGFDTCAITDDGLARCWGSNAEGEDGDCLGTSPRCGSVDRETVMSGMPPAPASAPFPNLQRISMGTFHACGLDTNGTVFCWGSGVHGQLAEQPGMFGPLVRGACPEPMGFGNGYYAPLAVPMLPAAIDVAASTFDSCAVLRDGTVRCWGGNTYGQLATCDPGDHIVPLTVAGIMGAEQVALGAAHACVRIQQRAVYCWGDNEDGRLGDGTTVSRATPEPVEW